MTLDVAFITALITLIISIGFGAIVYSVMYLCIRYIDPTSEVISYIVLAVTLLLLFTLIIYIGENNLLGLKDLK